jgi:hypothetical protein
MKALFKPEKIDLTKLQDINEASIQKIIADDPSILGLGDLILKDRERIQPRAGRLDLLLQDPETNRRYEVEIQLGKTDETHIIRILEYWDIERKRYPQYDHCAVIVAEDITSRFLNVISLFNGFIPLIAIQMNAYSFDGQIGIVFTKVLDEMPLGLVDEDEEIKELTDRSFWVKRSTDSSVKMVDEILEIINSFTPGYSLKYNKFYIGLAKNGKANNFVFFKPRKKYVRMLIHYPRSEEMDNLINENDLDDLGYESRGGRYRIQLKQGDTKKYNEVLLTLFKMADKYRNE